MNIQSLSIVVPTEKCVNNCAFCVSKQHHEEYGKNKIAVSNPAYSLALQEYRKRMAFARDNHCNTVILTGDAEPTQNKAFLATFGDMNRSLEQPIKNNGRALEVLEFGQTRYDVNGISTVLDDDCMSTVPKSDLKYLILRPNCHLYTKWDSTASLLF